MIVAVVVAMRTKRRRKSVSVMTTTTMKRAAKITGLVRVRIMRVISTVMMTRRRRRKRKSLFYSIFKEVLREDPAFLLHPPMALMPGLTANFKSAESFLPRYPFVLTDKRMGCSNAQVLVCISAEKKASCFFEGGHGTFSCRGQMEKTLHLI